MASQNPPIPGPTSRRNSKSGVLTTGMRATSTQASINEQATYSTPRPQQNAHSSLAAHIISEPNAFDESFSQALTTSTKPPKNRTSRTKRHIPHPVISTLDGQNDDDEHFPLLSHRDSLQSLSAPASPATVIRIPITSCPITAPRTKSKPSRGIYLSNELCHNSQYTRPAVDILRDLLEMYPLAERRVQTGGRFARDGSEAERGLLSDEPGRKKQWWRRALRMD